MNNTNTGLAKVVSPITVTFVTFITLMGTTAKGPVYPRRP